MDSLRRLLRITWQTMIPYTEVLKRAGLQCSHALLKKAQLRWAGHVVIMSDEIPKRMLYGELSVGRRYTGGQRIRYKDSLKSSLKTFEINNASWESLAAERGTWRSLIRKGTVSPMNKPGYARRKKRYRSVNPVLRKQALRLLLLFDARTATELFVFKSVISATSPTYVRPVMSWSSSPTDGRTR